MNKWIIERRDSIVVKFEFRMFGFQPFTRHWHNASSFLHYQNRAISIAEFRRKI